MKCRMRRKLADYQVGALGATQRAAMERHLQGCPACREYAALQEQLAPVIAYEMHTRWDARIEKYRPAPVPAISRIKTMSFRLALTFAVAVVVLGVVILGAPVLLRQILEAPSYGRHLERARIGLRARHELHVIHAEQV